MERIELSEALLAAVGAGAFPALNWKGISEWINTAPDVEKGRLWRDAAGAWAKQTCDAFNGLLAAEPSRRARYQLSHSSRLIVVAALPANVGEKWAAYGEWVMEKAIGFFGPIAVVPEWPTVVYFVHSAPALDAYLSHVAKKPGLLPMGFYVSGNDRLPHIAILGTLSRLSLRLVLIHELVHSLMHHLEMPLWLEEGICQQFELTDLQMYRWAYSKEVDARHLHWHAQNLGEFWNGRCFSSVGALDGYALALRMVRRLLAQGRELFFKFAAEARREDAGDGACRSVYGKPIVEVAGELLGPGDWAPPNVTVPQRVD